MPRLMTVYVNSVDLFNYQNGYDFTAEIWQREPLFTINPDLEEWDFKLIGEKNGDKYLAFQHKGEDI